MKNGNYNSVDLEGITRTLFIFAHPDDELPCVGLLEQRISENPDGTKAFWASNGDTITGENQVTELKNAINILQLRHAAILEEISEQKNITHLINANNIDSAKVIDHFLYIYKKIYSQIRSFTPHEVYTNAFEGGNIMHDIINFLTWLAVQEFNTKQPVIGTHNITLYEFPSYHMELVNSKPSIVYGRFGKQDDHETPKDGFVYKLDGKQLIDKEEYPNLYPKAAKEFKRIRDATEHDMRTWVDEHYRKVPVDRNYLEKPKPVMFYEEWGKHRQTDKGFEELLTFEDHFKPIVSALLEPIDK